MPARELQEQLNTLREQLEQNAPLSESERENLQQLMAQIQSQIELESSTQDSSLADGVNLAVERFVTPMEFEQYRAAALERGFVECVAGPLVRSSYRAEQALARNNAGLGAGGVAAR